MPGMLWKIWQTGQTASGCRTEGMKEWGGESLPFA